MKQEKCVIVLITHSDYIDICNNFIDLFNNNWSSCPFRVVGIVMGKPVSIKGIECIYAPEAKTLPECLLKAVRSYPAKYYMSFLGDAFIAQVVNQQQIDELLLCLDTHAVNYCSMLPKRSSHRSDKLNNFVRKIHASDRYAHSFIAFTATADYIIKHFSNQETDLDFELKYLALSNNANDYYFDKEVILTQNILSLYPGIDKGKWNRRVLRLLKKYNPTLVFSNRELLSWKEQIIYDIREVLVPFCPPIIRRTVKYLMTKTKVFTFVSKS